MTEDTQSRTSLKDKRGSEYKKASHKRYNHKM